MLTYSRGKKYPSGNGKVLSIGTIPMGFRNSTVSALVSKYLIIHEEIVLSGVRKQY